MSLDWFKFSISNDAAIYALEDDQAGQVIKAALYYFQTGIEIQLDPAARIAFAGIRRDIDKSRQAYKAKSEQNRANVQKRWAREPRE